MGDRFLAALAPHVTDATRVPAPILVMPQPPDAAIPLTLQTPKSLNLTPIRVMAMAVALDRGARLDGDLPLYVTQAELDDAYVAMRDNRPSLIPDEYAFLARLFRDMPPNSYVPINTQILNVLTTCAEGLGPLASAIAQSADIIAGYSEQSQKARTDATNFIPNCLM